MVLGEGGHGIRGGGGGGGGYGVGAVISFYKNGERMVARYSGG